MPEPMEIGIVAESEVDFMSFIEGSTLEHPTMGLKFINDVLHQKWLVTKYEKGIPTEHKEVWKPVPKESIEDENDNS